MCLLKMIKNLYKSSDKDFIEAVKTSHSIREVLIKLDLKPAGGNYKCFHERVKKLDLPIDHFIDPKAWNKGKTFGSKRDLKEYLVINNPFSITSNSLRKRLIAEGLKEHKCECCGIIEWMGKPAPIELDHINGNHHDNRLENLRILCPNCHAQTETYRGKNKRK